MENKTLTVVPKFDPDPVQIQEGFRTAKKDLQEQYAQAYAELERFTARDQKLARQNRLEKISWAIQNNLSDIPELKYELKRFLDNLPD